MTHYEQLVKLFSQKDIDYKRAFCEEAKKLLGKYDDIEERKRVIDELINAYIEARAIDDPPHLQRPPAKALSLLASELLRETLASKKTNKNKQDNIVVLSQSQLERRRKRELSLEDYANYETSKECML